MWEGRSLPHDTKFGNCRDAVADRKVIFIWSLTHGSSWSGLIKVGPGVHGQQHQQHWFHQHIVSREIWLYLRCVNSNTFIFYNLDHSNRKCPQVNVTGTSGWYMNIGLYNGLMLSGNMSLMNQNWYIYMTYIISSYIDKVKLSPHGYDSWHAAHYNYKHISYVRMYGLYHEYDQNLMLTWHDTMTSLQWNLAKMKWNLHLSCICMLV